MPKPPALDGVDAACRALVFLVAVGGKTVITAPAYPLRLEPAILHQAKHRCSYQAITDTEGVQCLDQAAQPQRAAVLRHHIPEQRDDQGGGPQGLAPGKLRQQAFYNDGM